MEKVCSNSEWIWLSRSFCPQSKCASSKCRRRCWRCRRSPDRTGTDTRRRTFRWCESCSFRSRTRWSSWRIFPATNLWRLSQFAPLSSTCRWPTCCDKCDAGHLGSWSGDSAAKQSPGAASSTASPASLWWSRAAAVSPFPRCESFCSWRSRRRPCRCTEQPETSNHLRAPRMERFRLALVDKRRGKADRLRLPSRRL